jgi:hypothetical protein
VQWDDVVTGLERESLIAMERKFKCRELGVNFVWDTVEM